MTDATTAAEPAYDVFVCHATEDKAGFVEPLVAALDRQGIKPERVWYDRFAIPLGGDFVHKMSEGLRTCRYDRRREPCLFQVLDELGDRPVAQA